MNIKPLVRFIQAREELRLNRVKYPQLPSMWTKDDILSQFHFCNIDREDDRVTKWVAKHVRPFCKRDLAFGTFQLLVARIFNDPDVLEDIMPVRDVDIMYRTLRDRQRAGLKVFRGAYMMTTCGADMTSIEYFRDLLRHVKDDLKIGEHVDALWGVSQKLMRFKGIGDFLANQVCTDLRYIDEGDRWDDWNTFVLAGPGTKRGMNRICHREVKASITQSKIYPELMSLKKHLKTAFGDLFQDPNNVANSLCEFDKYQRAQEMDVPRLKRRYHPSV